MREHHILKMLIDEGRIKPELAKEMSWWKYTGFSVHKDVLIDGGDEEGLMRLSEYIARCPVAEARITQDSPGDDIIYNAERHEHYRLHSEPARRSPYPGSPGYA